MIAGRRNLGGSAQPLPEFRGELTNPPGNEDVFEAMLKRKEGTAARLMERLNVR
jgi:hypothetical protein